MNRKPLFKACRVTAVAFVAILSGGRAGAQDRVGDYEPPADVRTSQAQDGQVLTRGPVHEAFAETVLFDPEPGMVAPRSPPPQIEERPPSQRPDGPDVEWIPGYWAWDEDYDDYLWVSGIWRSLPPDRQWFSGYWTQTDQGHMWVSGYWAAASASEVEYLPPPPESLEVGAGGVQPALNQFWVPGSWIWHAGRYVWRPGYWAAVRQDWDWIPTRYVWTPRGCIFVDGHWDHAVTRRGVLFAPIYFNQPAHARLSIHFSPSVALDLSFFVDHLFVRPRYHHYYFGDYYDARYEGRGYYSSHSTRFDRGFYDPIIVHKRWENRRDLDWDRRSEDRYRNYRDHEQTRPRRTLNEQRAVARGDDQSRNRARVVTKQLSQLVNRKHDPIRFKQVDRDEQQSFERRGRDLQNFQGERRKLEKAEPRKSEEHGQPDMQPARVRYSKSPIAARQTEQRGKDRTPPSLHRAPQPDPQVQPRRKTVRKVERKD